jgi:transposase-like protein
MDPQRVFCPNPACPARGQCGQGNIGIHSQKERRYKCHECGKTFAESTGTVFYRLRSARSLVVIVITLLAYGCPIQAIVAAFKVNERTVVSWQERAGKHCEAVHKHLIEQPRDLGQVQADEMRVKKQGGIVWMASALQVSTRLWLGGVVSAKRDRRLITTMMRQVRACALCRPLLFCVDGCQAYVHAIQRAFTEPMPTGQRGRPRLRPWDNIHIAQVVKQYAQKRVVGIQRRVVQGTIVQINALLLHTQNGGQINVAYIERLNATFRARIAALVRRSRALARQTETLHHAMYLMGSVYNFCTYHQSLRVPIFLPANRWRWISRTPAIAAGITDHLWTVEELLSLRVPLSPWTPPKRRGRPSNLTKSLVAQWSS